MSTLLVILSVTYAIGWVVVARVVWRAAVSVQVREGESLLAGVGILLTIIAATAWPVIAAGGLMLGIFWILGYAATLNYRA